MKHLITLLYMSAVLLIPLLPAYLLYRTLPAESSVKGPFKGLTINLKGAFAGYFLLVLIASGFAAAALISPKPTHEVWRITGTLKAPDAFATSTGNRGGLAGIEISVTPANYTITKKGEFDVTVIIKPGHVEGERVFPTLVFGQQGRIVGSLVLGGNISRKLNVDPHFRTGELIEPVTLERLAAESVNPPQLK